MLIHPTVERLRDIGLSAMADALIEMQNNPEAADLPHADWLGLLIDREVDGARQPAPLAPPAEPPSCVRPPSSRTSICAPLADSTVRFSRPSPPATGFANTSTWPSPARPAPGKAGSPVRSATRPAATASPCSTSVPRASSPISPRRAARAGSRRLMTTLERANLLIIDDWGPEPLNAEQRRDLLEIVDDRYDRGSLLITSQIPVSAWHDVIGDPTLGDAILDRVLHTAHRIELKGDSLRRKASVKSPA